MMKRIAGTYATHRRLRRLDSEQASGRVTRHDRPRRPTTRFVTQSHALGGVGDPRPMIVAGLAFTVLVALVVRWSR